MNSDFTITLRIPRDLADDIDVWRFYERVPSRMAAIRQLLRIAFDTEAVDTALQRAKEQRR